jgi:anti-anti-sigma factor
MKVRGAKGLPITCEESEGQVVLRLEGEIDVACSAELKSALVQGISSAKSLQINTERVSDLDITALQLFWAAKRDAEGRGAAFVLAKDVPEAVRNAIHEAGFETLLGSLIPTDAVCTTAGAVTETADD